MGKIRVLHIITHLPIGGAQDNTLLTVEGLNKDQYDVTLLTGPGGEWLGRARQIPDLKVIIVPEIVREINLFYDIISIIKIFKIIKKHNYQIVHTHSSKPGFSGRIASKLAGVPHIIHTIHGFPFNDYMPRWQQSLYVLLERCLGRFTQKLITVCNLNKEKAIKLCIAPRNKFITIYSGIDFSKFHFKGKVDKERLFGISNSQKIVGMVGRLSKQKAPQIFIDAIPKVLIEFPDTMFLLIGDGELRPQLELQIKQLGIENNIVIQGFREDIPQVLSCLDIFVLSSLWEGLGRSLTEAMYMKCPVVATGVEGVPELVENEVVGLLVEPDDPDAISAGILALLKDASKAKRLAENAHSRVAHDFDAEKMVAEIHKLYQDCLAKSK